jgi:putative autoinducer-2 (AI-2) aldolase
MGRNIFQRKVPEAMIQAVRGVVHGGLSPEQAQSMYQELSGGLAE